MAKKCAKRCEGAEESGKRVCERQGKGGRKAVRDETGEKRCRES